ncbi:2OG-FeII oxygenase superfamily protein [Hokovirus HKV1]|uniref:2OG-FeII oxygenase superfamily protein n=1 Tax=Hokovirus HKV1 TaxID=1977638 RepID=A0A1V0SGX4_9VIRU|nr:2OG-FeII oxygenase superfamily protein [Hokovirus HKV1]
MSFSQIMSKYGQTSKGPIFVKPEQKKNNAFQYASSLIKSDIDKVDSDMIQVTNEILKNGCIYLPNFICETNNYDYFDKIKKELEPETNVIQWSKHYKFENPEFSKTFNEIIEKIKNHFNVEVLCTRLNYYKNGNDYKPLHHDSHAFSNNKKENFTVGISFGASREITFMHVKSKKKFNFPQNNGDLFAFNDIINKEFMHGIPKANINVKERISIIAWCKK